MRQHTFWLLLLSSITVSSCVSVNRLNQSLEQPHIDIGIREPLTKPFANISIPTGVKIDSVLSPLGFPSQSFSYKTGILVLPLLIYNQFQSNFMVTLGAKQFVKPVHESFKERFSTLLTSCEDSSRITKESYTVSLELQSCMAQGIFVQGGWGYFYGYGSMSGEINHGRNASSTVRIRWEMSKGEEPVLAGDVLVLLKDPYVGSVAGFLMNHGRRKELTKDNLNFEVPFHIEFGPDAYLNNRHIVQIVQTLCLGLDEASEVILSELQEYFLTIAKP